MNDKPNQDQIEYWNGETGDKWVKHADDLDGMLAPFIDMILSAANLKSGEAVMDVGCGSGALSRAAVEKVGPNGHVTGVDISEPMLGLARQRNEQSGQGAAFLEADASQYDISPKADIVISRFGVMFFDDPVGAFANIRGNVKAGGRLAFACWRSPFENGWALTPLQIALPFLPEPPTPPEPGTPGPFAFADQDHLCQVLETAGWQDVTINAENLDMVLPGKAAAESAGFMLKMGPLAVQIREHKLDIGPIKTAITEHFQSIVNDKGELSLPGAVWIVTARA